MLPFSGYKTHLVGKWHLGHYTSVSTPTHRGFDSFFGFYNYGHDHFNHTHDGFLDLFEGCQRVQRTIHFPPLCAGDLE